MQILEVNGGSHFPLPAKGYFQCFYRTQAMNKVTVYRILELLVEDDFLERLRTGGRSTYYGFARMISKF